MVFIEKPFEAGFEWSPSRASSFLETKKCQQHLDFSAAGFCSILGLFTSFWP
jgi:hypothetical protein